MSKLSAMGTPKTYRVTAAYNHKPNEPITVIGPTLYQAVKLWIAAQPADAMLIGVLYQGEWVD